MKKRKKPRLREFEEVRDYYAAWLSHLGKRYPNDQPARVARWLREERELALKLERRRLDELMDQIVPFTASQDREFDLLAERYKERARARRAASPTTESTEGDDHDQ